MAEKLFKNVLTLTENEIEISEQKIYTLGMSAARVTKAIIMADVKSCGDKPICVKVQYNDKPEQIVDYITPQANKRISINVTEELNCLIRLAFQEVVHVTQRDKIKIIFKSKIVLENIDLFVEYIPEQIMHENSAYVEFNARGAGSGKVNLATGKLRFNHQCGVLSLVYNNWQAKKRSTTVYDVKDTKTKYRHSVGRGFKLNVEQFLIKRQGTESQTIYTYVDGEGNYHEFSEKYYYIDDKGQKVYIPKSIVKVDASGNLKYAIRKNCNKSVYVERGTTNGLFLNQDNSIFKDGQYIEQRQQQQIELEENIAALERQLKTYTIVDAATGKNNQCYDELRNPFRMNGKLSIANYERFLNRLIKGRLLLSESEAIQYRSLLLQQTSDEYVDIPSLEIKDSVFNKETNYSDNPNQEGGEFHRYTYDKKLINLRRLVSHLREDLAKLTKKENYSGNEKLNYLYTEYYKYLAQFKDDCALLRYNGGNYIDSNDFVCGTPFIDDNYGMGIYDPTANTGGMDEILAQSPDSYLSKSISRVQHLKNGYCDLQAEIEYLSNIISGHSIPYEISNEYEQKEEVQRRINEFQKEFSNRADKLQQNITIFEVEINKFVEREQREIVDEQIKMMFEKSESNKVDLEKYFKQYYNKTRELTQYNWQIPTHFITGKEGTVMGFNKDGYLVALFGGNGNQMAIVYEKGRISYIQDQNKNTILFEYGTDKRIKKITTPDAKTYQLAYEGGLLTTIVDINGDETRLGYDKYGFLNTIVDNFDYGVRLSYDNYGRVETVNQATQIDSVTDGKIDPAVISKSELIASINYHDSHLTTSVTNNLQETTTYNFDIMGKVVTMYKGLHSNEKKSIRAQSFEYTENKRNFSISEKIYGDNLLEGKEQITLNGATEADFPKPLMEEIKVVFKDKKVTDYVFSVWAKADSAYVESARNSQYTNPKIDEIYKIENDSAKLNRKFEVRAEVSYNNSKESDKFVAEFDWLNTDWQYIALPIEVDPNKEFDKCVITLDYSFNVGEVTFDRFSLMQGSWVYCTFDDDGRKKTEERSESKNITTYFYDEQGKLIREELKNSKGKLFTNKYEYNANGELVRSINYAGMVEENVFDEDGKLVKKLTYHIDDPTSKFYTESKSAEKGVVVSKVDESGEYDSATYTYDANGEVAVVADGKGNKTAFGYKDGNLVSISGSTNGEESTNIMKYTAGLLTRVCNGDTFYNYGYDGWGRTTQVKIAGQDYLNTEYVSKTITKNSFGQDKMFVTVTADKEKNTRTIETKFGTIDKETVIEQYDEQQNLASVSVDINDDKSYTIIYTRDKDQLKSEQRIRHLRSGKSYVDSAELIKKHEYTDDGDLLSTTYQVLKDEDASEEEKYAKLVYKYLTDGTPDKRGTKVVLPLDTTQQIAYDGLGRIKELSLGENLAKDVYYAKYGDHATKRVNSVWFGINGIRKENTKYTYDKTGNVETVSENGKLVSRYHYDGLNRLVREDNVVFGTFTYQYDTAGNIVSKTKYDYTLSDSLVNGESVEYVYKQNGWKDQLVSLGAEQFSYDMLGNPTLYRDRKLSWQGRRLASYDTPAGKIEYTYDASGIRTSKNRGGVTYNYIYDGDKLIVEKHSLNKDAELLYYIYGLDGIVGFKRGDSTYLFRKNVQGDVTHIYEQIKNEPLKLVAKYVYDAWGKNIVLDAEGKVDENKGSIGNKNPFRYRSYYYDSETKLYYLQTRYYDPEIGRFINADSIEYLDPEKLGGLNLYSYCVNNPIMYADSQGTSAQSALNAVGNFFVSAGKWINNNIINPVNEFFTETVPNAIISASHWVNDNIIQPVKTFFTETLPNAIVEAANWTYDNILCPAYDFFTENWDIVIGGLLVVAGVVLAIATFGAATCISAVICGMALGALFGGINALATGGDIAQGIVTGMLIGALGGISAPAAGLAAAGMSMINDRINGKKPGADTVVRAVYAGVTAGFFAQAGGAFNEAVFLTEGFKLLGSNVIYGLSTATVVSTAFFSSLLFTVVNWAFDTTIGVFQGK